MILSGCHWRTKQKGKEVRLIKWMREVLNAMKVILLFVIKKYV